MTCFGFCLRINAIPSATGKDVTRRLIKKPPLTGRFRPSTEVPRKVTSDAGFIAYRELDDALGLTEVAGGLFQDSRTGKNGRHGMVGSFASPFMAVLVATMT